MDVAPARPKTPLILIVTQLVVASFLAWMAIRTILETNTPSPLLWAAIGCVALTAITHTPPVFFRASINGRYGIYIAMVASLLFLGLSQEPPRPVTIAATNKEATSTAAGHETGSQQSPNFRAPEYQEKLDSCFSWSGNVPDLIDKVKLKIHNPSSFEYIDTEKAKDPRADVIMRFRAESEFGATRRYKAYGVMRNDSDCEFILFSIDEDD